MKKYIMNQEIRSFQGDRYGYLRPVILLNYLQAVADSHVEDLGIGKSYCAEHGLAWVAIHHRIKIENTPRAGQIVKVVTWSSKMEMFRANREFLILDEFDNVLVRAISQWVLIDINTRKPVLLKDNLPVTDSLDECAYDIELKKIDDFQTDKVMNFDVMFDNIDGNQHVNNAIYILWASESLGFDFRNTHRLSEIFVDFRKEIPAGVLNVKLESKLDGVESFHKIISGDSELNCLLKCKWIENNS